MAGMALPISNSNTERENHEVPAEIGEWLVGYARFIFCSSSARANTNPSLVPVAKNRRRGTWISAGAATSVKLVYQISSGGKDDAVLTISLGSKTLEVHCISKIQISWPQVLCMSGFPARGSRAVLLSYKDEDGQMQKFALRFASLYETENFMNVVKIIMETGIPKLLQGPEINSGMSSEAEATLSHVTLSKGNNKGNSTQLSSVLRSSQDSEPHEGLVGGEAVKAEPFFPPGFTQLMNSCGPEASGSCSPSSIVPFIASLADYLGAASKLGSGDLKTQFVQYLEGTSFKDLLATVENVIGRLGDGMVL